MLVHHADPVGDGVGRAAEPHGLAPQQDLARVGLVQPEHRVHQRALAGPVLAEQAVDLTLVEREVDVLVGDDAGEGLGEAPHLEDGDASLVAHRVCRASGWRGGRTRPSSRRALQRQTRGGVEAGRDGAVGEALAGLLQLGGDVVGDVGVVERRVGDAAVRRREAEDAAGELALQGVDDLA